VNPKGKELAEVQKLRGMERVRGAGNLLMYPILETFR
jgi:hypothetical protein